MVTSKNPPRRPPIRAVDRRHRHRSIAAVTSLARFRLQVFPMPTSLHVTRGRPIGRSSAPLASGVEQPVHRQYRLIKADRFIAKLCQHVVDVHIYVRFLLESARARSIGLAQIIHERLQLAVDPLRADGTPVLRSECQRHGLA